MFILYDLIFTIFILSYLPIFVFKRKFHNGFMMRLGFLPEALSDALIGERPIWVHAVSVGEVLASRQLIEGLHKAYPGRKIVISTVTPSGNKIAKSFSGHFDIVIYLPLDFSFIVRRVVNTINPFLFVIAETEIWPNLISYMNSRGIPIVTVNARISDTSFRGYSAFRFLLRHVLNKISLFCVQTPTDSERLSFLGVKKEKICITGNMKFDNTDYADYAAAAFKDSSRSLLRLGSKDKLLVAGSTHPPEEDIIISAYLNLLREFPGLRLLIAPRHPERAQNLARAALVEATNFQFFLVSSLKAYPPSSKLVPIFILDIMGGLGSFYQLADIVFVGGSLVKKGGHNILEPAFFAKPIIFGPHMFNFRDMARTFVAHCAAFQVENPEELTQKIRFLLNNSAQAAELGRRANELLLQNRGASERNLAKIKEIVSAG